MSQPLPDPEVSDMSVARAKRLLREMTEKSFCVLIFDGDKVWGYSKGLDPDTITGIQELVAEL